MKNSSQNNLSADCRPTVGRLSANCRPTNGRQSADKRPTVGRQIIKAIDERTFYFSIMNHFELLTLIQSFHSIFTFLVDRGLIASRSECSCGSDMVLKERQNTPDGFIWECPSKNCRRRRSIRTGSFFEDSKIPLGQWLYVIFLWSIDESNKRLSLLTGLSLRTVVTTLEKLRNVCSWKILNGTAKGKLPGYLDEFNWQRNYPGDHFEHMLVHIAEMYPVN